MIDTDDYKGEVGKVISISDWKNTNIVTDYTSIVCYWFNGIFKGKEQGRYAKYLKVLPIKTLDEAIVWMI